MLRGIAEQTLFSGRGYELEKGGKEGAATVGHCLALIGSRLHDGLIMSWREVCVQEESCAV